MRVVRHSDREAAPAAVVVAAILAVALALVGVVAAGCGSAGGSDGATPAVGADGVKRIEIRYADESVTGGVSRWDVSQGDTVDLVVTSDIADDVHLHGYDRLTPVAAGDTATLRFVANLPGVFDVELEQRGVLVARLEVS
jgi:hypothetical protein